ncbi:MAG TPA: ubiquitin-like domain-containing protein [Mycobacteriales bacterium]|nr:ubiquitin-like domain-containing protein [Mycobacteriales bacterium]
MSRRLAQTLVRSLVLALLLGAGATYVSADKTVTVVVDGEERQVRTFGRTVAAVLTSARLEVGEHDVLAPAREVRVDEDSRIVVRRGRQLDLMLNGKPRTVWVTALTVEDALGQLAVRNSALAFVSASRSKRIPLRGLSLEVRTPASVRVAVDGRTQALTTTAATVGDVLLEAGVTVAATDVLSVPAGSLPVPGMVVKVTRIRGRQVVEKSPIPFPVERRNDASMYKGRTKVSVVGVIGIRERTYAVTYTDNRVSAKKLVRDRTLRQPRTKIVLVGTKPVPPPASVNRRTSVDHLNWPALARCESGGRPRAVSPNGLYRGLYQFHRATWRSVGGTGDPIDASSAEQTFRAKRLYLRSGAGQWPHCGRRLFS